MASAAMRDYQATISIRAHFGKNQMTDMLQKFQIAHKYVAEAHTLVAAHTSSHTSILVPYELCQH
jgi:hypothetical protein